LGFPWQSLLENTGGGWFFQQADKMVGKVSYVYSAPPRWTEEFETTYAVFTLKGDRKWYLVRIVDLPLFKDPIELK
jgi:hypothetical protein